MSKTIKEIIAIASQATKPKMDSEGDIPTMDASYLFDKAFDEKEEIVDQYEKLFNVNTTKTLNTGQAFIGESKSTWEDAPDDLDFFTTNDSMLEDNIRAHNGNPDDAQPTISRETPQSLSKLNVGKPIDLGQNIKLARQSAMNYRDGNIVDELPETDNYVMSSLKNAALFGLKNVHAGLKAPVDEMKKNLAKNIKDTVTNTIKDKIDRATIENNVLDLEPSNTVNMPPQDYLPDRPSRTVNMPPTSGRFRVRYRTAVDPRM